jgi:UPF0755 protein
MRNRWLLRIVLALVLSLACGSVVLSVIYYRLYYQPMVRSDKALLISLPKTTTAISFANNLAANHLIGSKRLFVMLMQIKGVSSQLKAGIYQIKKGESALEFLERVVKGDVLTLPFRIIEGSHEQDVSANLQKAPYLNYNPSDWLTVAPIGSPVEGLLLADTYQYPAGSSSRLLLQHAARSLQQYLIVSWQNRAPDLPYKTPYELLIVASILEKEAALSDEKRLISGVVVNRLRKKMPLQMDPTVLYARDYVHNNGTHHELTLMHQDLKIDSPYNTYRYRGLPPTPIAMVGRDAIDAAAHPTVSNYVYFVAKGDGSHQFSATYDEQKQAIIQYLRKRS